MTMKKKWFCLSCCLLLQLFFVVGAFAQTRTIKGKVVDETGQPVVGVSVVVKGTTKGAITNADGLYSISASAKDVLLFSCVSYKPTQEKIGDRSLINVSLGEDATMLKETVVTAEFGVKRAARSVGAAVQSVKGSDIAESGRTNFINALQGRVAGVNITSSSGNPGASSTIVFRAPTSISGKNYPLYVIDGIPMSNTTFDPSSQAAQANLSTTANDYTNRGSDIDPENIESVTVLKGAAAAALYGSDASNGAIIITTKKGRSGKAKLSYSNDFRFDKLYRYPEVQKIYDQGYYGTTNYYTYKRFGAPYAEGTKLYDNLKDLFRTGLTQRHTVSLEAGNDAMTVRASAGVLDQTGVIPVASYKRTNLDLAGTIKANKWLNIEASMQYINSKNTKTAKGVGGDLYYALLWPLTDNMKNYIDADGSSIKYPDKYKDIDILNPYFDIYKNKRYDTSDRFISAFNINIDPFKDFSIKAQVGWDVSSSVYITCINPQWTTLSSKTGSFDQSNVNESNPTLNLLAMYKKEFNKFNMNAQVGYHQLENSRTIMAVYGSNFYVQDLQSINNCAQSTISNKQITTKRRIQAVSGSFEFSYNNLAFLTLRGRNDWSSTLPTDNRSYFYPAADLSFMLSDLPFMKKNSDVWNYIKLRASVARVGKDADPLSITPSLELQTTTNGGYLYGYTGPNNSLKPEMNTSWETGIEGHMFDNRLNFDLAYYKTDSKDQIISQFRMSYASGFVLNTRNMGSFRTNGVEFLVSYDFIRNNDWLLNIGVNGSRNWSKVLSLPEGVTEYYNAYTWVVGNIRNGMTVGSPITSVTGNDYQRNSKGQILIDPTSGLPLTNSTWSKLGDREPKLSYGITANLKYKNWSLSCLFSGKWKTTVINGTKKYMLTYGVSKESVEQRNMGAVVFNGVLKDGNQNTDNPTTNNIAVKFGDLQAGYTGADPDWIESGVNYIKLSQLRLAYKVNPAFVSKMTHNVVSSLTLSAAGTDLFLLTNYSGIDPECNANSSALGGTGGVGFDMLSVGAPRGFSFGLNVTF